MQPTVAILILAAGASSRMRGRDKLLQSVAGQPLLRRVAETALATGMPVLVTLPPEAEARRAALAGLDVRIVEIPDASQGMSRSLVRGLASVAAMRPDHVAGLMILPADMPDFTPPALDRLIAAFRGDPGQIWRGATADGEPGHPIIFPRDLWPALAQVSGDEGGRSVLQVNRDRVRLLPLPGRMATRDLDTPEDWAAYLGRPE
ncbi:nucleotidyltransferase family protein [Rhodobacter calidifons]|uniref:Nucleotidyltransferase family protein n=1 Tax=Rhodobacter calidifons TaxID=2715277 RepID=A0ABX0G7N0_9RHOB|nr:nucleotidyltransferase family protein [Rhodobacter calidifons]NHB77229.1 nucleotidyltransferase family protein [Rhodobacter calidifons]